MKDKQLIGIMGGTFDPPHLGHLLSAESAASQLGLSKVLFLPNGKTVYKQRENTASPKQRFEMTRLAISDNDLFEISDIETRSSQITYTFDTLEKLHTIYKNAHFFFIVGADSLDYMDKWKNPKRIFDLCTVVAVGRAGFSQERLNKKAQALKEKFDADIVFVTMPNIEISSSDLKNRIKNGNSVRYMLSDLTLRYIKDNGLYIENSGENSDDGRK